MRRYQPDAYPAHFVCFQCRKQFKSWHPRLMPMRQRWVPSGLCPDCGEPMWNAGIDFKPPKKANSRAWRRLMAMYTAGTLKRAEDCNCCTAGAVNYPTRKQKHRMVLAKERSRLERAKEGH